MEREFVRVHIYADEGRGKFLGFAWGVWDGNDTFRLLFTRSKRVGLELGYTGSTILDHQEFSTCVPADETNTPGKAWAELAKYRLLGEDEEGD